MATTQNAKLVPPNDSILTKIAEEIHLPNLFSEETSGCIEAMLRIAVKEQSDKGMPTMVGLAAPQIGISKRIILIDVKADGKGNVGDLRVYLNPEIVWRSEEENEWYEGCFSTSRVCGIVSRPSRIKVRAWTPKGQRVEEEHSGYVARIFQHEIDHLDGKVFVSQIKDDTRLHWVEREEFSEYRDKEGWRSWPKKCPRQKWERIKLFGE